MPFHAASAASREPQRQAVGFERQNVSINEDNAMSSLSFRSSRPDSWTMPRPYRDASMRYATYGPIRPMEQPGLLARLFGRG